MTTVHIWFPHHSHFQRARFIGAFVIFSIAFMIMPSAHGQERSPSCKSGHFAEFKDLVALANHFKESEQADDMVSIFERSLSCPERIWQTENTKLGTLPTYFYDVTTSSVCLWEKDKGCRPAPKVLRDIEFQRSVADLIGYSTLYSREQRKEFLILNKSASDFARKTRIGNQSWVSSHNQKVTRCSSLATPQSIPLQKIELNSLLKDHYLEGFCVHESFHLHQRDWPKRKVHSEKLNFEKQTKLPLANALTERLIFHLLKYIENKQGRDKDEALKHLKLAKGAYIKFRKEAPMILSARDNKDEGTADFVEARTQALMKLGCEAPDEKIRSETIQNLMNDVARQTAFQDSPYVLSALASLALDLNEKPDWHRVVERTEKTPLDILLDDTTIDARDVDLDSAKALVECLSKD